LQFNPDDVWGSINQYNDPRGRVSCAAATAYSLIAMANGVKLNGKIIDSFITKGLQSYKEIMRFRDEEWERASKGLGDLAYRFEALEWQSVFKGSIDFFLKPTGAYTAHIAPPEREELSGDMPSYKALNDEDFGQIFGPLISKASSRDNGGKPVVASIVISNGSGIAQTFGVCVQVIKGVVTYKLFNSHGTDVERNSMSGLDNHPARLNCFLQNNIQGTAEMQFRTYFATLLGTILTDAGGQVDVNMCEAIKPVK